MNERLYRSRDDRVIAGVAGGLADYLNLDPSLVRVLWAVLAVLTGGILFVVYIVMMIVVPEEPADWDRWTSGTTAWSSSNPSTGWASTAGTSTSTQSSAAPATGAEATSPGESTAPTFDTALNQEGRASSETATSETATSETATTAPPVDPTVATPGSYVPGSPKTWAAGTGWGSAPGTDDWRRSRDAERWARRQERRARRADRRVGRDGFGAVVFGTILIVIGGFFLLRAYVPSFDSDRFWPIALVIVGVVFLLGSIRPGADADS